MNFLLHSLRVVIDVFPKVPFLKIQLLSYNSAVLREAVVE
jgi:hypothetical protein